MATAQYYEELSRRIAAEEFADNPALAAVLYRMLRQESGSFDPNVWEGRRRSSAGAIGGAQFMPQTAANLGIDPLNPEQAIRGAARYLRENIQTFGGDVAKGVAAYNAGPGGVQNAVSAGGASWISRLPGETQQYLQIVQPSGTVPMGGQRIGTADPSQNVRSAIPNADPSQNERSPMAQPPGYVFPVQGYSGKVNKHWGEDDAVGATDLFAPEGTPVLAMTGGTVESVSNQGAGGNNVTIRGDDGRVYYYAHLYQAPSVKQGQKVSAGQQIGGVGETGNAAGTGAHLHIGIGESIQRGTGAYGGSGTNFDAVGFLTQVQSGTAPAPAGGTGMAATSASGGTGFAVQQLAKAEAAVRYWEQWQADMSAKPESERSKFDTQRLKFLENADHPEGHLARARGVYADAQVMAQREADLNPQATGANGAQNAQAITNWVTGIGGYQNQVTANAIAAANASTTLLTSLFGTQLDRARLVKDIFDANNAAMSAYLKDQVAAGNLKLDGAVQIAQTHALQQAAEAVRATEVTTRAKIINDADFRNAERMLPPGTHYVPGLESADAGGTLAQSMAKIGLNFPGVRVTPTDWAKLDPRTAFADAEKTVKPVLDFEVEGVKAAAAENAGITPMASTMITAEGVGVPNAPDFSGIQIPQVSSSITPGEGGIPTTAEMVDMILGRGKYAPPPPAAAGATTPPASVTTPAPTPATPPAQPTDTFAAHAGNLIPGTTQFQPPSGGGGATPSARVNPPPYQPGEAPAVAGAQPQQDLTAEAIERIKERLKAWGLPVAAPNPASVVNKARKWIR